MQSCCGPAGKNPRRSSLRRLCVLRLPRKEKPRLSRRQSAPQLLQEALCTASATQRGAAAHPATIRAAAPSGGSVYTASATQRKAAAQPATIRAAAPSGGSVYLDGRVVLQVHTLLAILIQQLQVTWRTCMVNLQVHLWHKLCTTYSPCYVNLAM